MGPSVLSDNDVLRLRHLYTESDGKSVIMVVVTYGDPTQPQGKQRAWTLNSMESDPSEVTLGLLTRKCKDEVWQKFSLHNTRSTYNKDRRRLVRFL